MKKKLISLLLTIFCVLSFVNASVDNCKTYGSNEFTCSQCYPGDTLFSGNCTCMIPNCDSCSVDSSNNTICGRCSAFFGPQDGSDNSTCYSCYIDGCWNCSLNSLNQPTCHNCSGGYFLQNNKCAQCSDVIPNCQNCVSANGSVVCLGCNADYMGRYYSNGTNCIACGSDSLSQNCQRCENYGKSDYSTGFSSGSCEMCQDGYAYNNITYFCSNSCNISNCKYCSTYSSSCVQCNDGYSWDYPTQSCVFCNISNCSYCYGGSCYNCVSGFFTNQSGKCFPCNGTAISNCLSSHCGNNSNQNQTCSKCNVDYTLSQDYQSCVKCSNLLSNCLRCDSTYIYNDLLGQSYYTSICSKCDTGYHLQYMNDNLTYVCTQNCSSKHIYNDTLQMCVPCTDLFGPGCSSCNSTQCLTCESNYYKLLLPEANLTCSQCSNQSESIVNSSNVSLCSRKENIHFQNFTTINNSKSAFANLTCAVASSKAFFAYGPADNLQSITLAIVQAKVGSSKNITIPSTADTNWIGYGVKKQNGTNPVNITLVPPLRHTGEKYRLTVWCQSAVNASDVANSSQEWTQPDNGGKKTKISFTTSGKLTSTQKKSLGVAIKKTLKIYRDIYTDDGELVPAKVQTQTGSRILSSFRTLADNNTVTFIIVPDYTADTDFTSTLINQTVSNTSNNFVQNVTNYWNSLNSSNTIQLSNVTTSIFSSSIPSPILSSVTLSHTDSSLTVSFTLTNTDGTFYAGCENTTYGLQYSNLSTAGMTSPIWSQFIQGLNANSLALYKFANLSVTANQSSSITLQGLDSNKTYMVYYGASNNDVPPVYSLLYVNVTNTIGSDGGNGNGSGSFRFAAWTSFLVALILLW